MKTLRKSVFWLHLAVGLVAGILVPVMSVTGTLMAFERQITQLADGFSDLRSGRNARTWIRTGEADGLPNQSVANLAAIFCGMLVWTGFSLSAREFVRFHGVA